MLVLGLTGSIATGKSTVSRLLSSRHNLPLIDADLLARLVVEPSTPAYAAIVRYFSPTTPDLLLPSGALDRAALGRRVFGDSEQAKKDRAVLNGIVHPAVRKAMAVEIVKAYAKGHWCVVVDVPLLFEAGLDVFCGAVVVVATSEERQLQRLVKRDGKGEEEARSRVNSQMGIADKVEKCRQLGEGEGQGGSGWVVDNNGSLEELEREVERVVGEVRKGGMDGWWAKLLWALPPLALFVGVVRVVQNWWRSRKAKKGKLEKAKL